MSERIRLDLALEARGLLPSRARARDAVLRGTVRVNGQVAGKPHQLVSHSDALTLEDAAANYVSRASLKLIAGLDAAEIVVVSRTCLDIGASTGGFTQVLLERGAARIYAVDVGHDQLHTSLRGSKRVISIEGTNARDLSRDLVPDPIDLLVCDVSFVSATKVLAQPLALCRPGADALVLIKPQFEVGRDHVGKGGIVFDSDAIARANREVIAFMADQGFKHRLSILSPINGGDGNTETVAAFRAPA